MSMGIPPGADLSKIPLLPNPDGSPSNFDDPPNLTTETYSVTILLMVISTVILPLRLHANFKTYRKLAIDDFFCIIGWVLASTYGIVVMTSTSTARHIWDVPISAVDASWIKRSAVLGTIYGPAMWFVKTAILTLYLRIFNPMRWMRYCCWFGIGFLFCAYWSLVPVSVIYNFPHGDEKWDLNLSLSSKPTQVPFVVMGTISVVSDLYILILPLPILLTLQTSWKRKVGICLIFMTAIIGIVSSCLVLYFRIVLWRNKTLDSTWEVASSYLTVYACSSLMIIDAYLSFTNHHISVVELFVAVLVSCAPAAVASWKILLRDSLLFSSLRSLLSSTSSLVLRVTPGSSASRRLPSGGESTTEFAFSEPIQLRPREEGLGVKQNVAAVKGEFSDGHGIERTVVVERV